MTKMTMTMAAMALTAACWAEPQAGSLKEQMPFGVFWAWDRGKFNGQVLGTNVQGYAEKTLKLLREMNCDAAWFVHGPGSDASWFMPMMERYGIRGMVGTDLINFYYSDDVKKGQDFVLKRAKDSARLFAPHASLLGYVLKDEPLLCNVQHTDYFYEALHKADPNHDAAVIAMPTEYQTYIEDTRLGVVCTDFYHFGGEGSRWVPNTPSSSRWHFRNAVHNAVTAATRAGKNAWIMPMVFGNTWGPHYWDKDGRHWALPGAYFHWRMPTPAEARWEVWEAARGGSKGILFYLLNEGRTRPTEADMSPDSPRYKKVNAELEEYHLVEKFGTGVLSKEKKELDPGIALTVPGGDPTPQFKAIGGAFGALAPHKGLLLKSRRATFPVFYPEDAFVHAQTFQRDGDSARLGIVVSDDVDAARKVRIRVAKNVDRVLDLNGGELKLSEAGDGVFRSFELSLEPGGGAILAASFKDGHAGFPLLREDFSRGRTKGSIDADVAEQSRFTMFGIGADWQLKLKKGADASKPAFKLGRLTNMKAHNNTAFMNLNRKQKDATIFLDLLGDLKAAEVTAVLDVNAAAEQTDILHTGQKTVAKDGDAAPRRVIWKSGDLLPVTIPVGTTGLEFRLGSSEDSLREIALWAVIGK